MRDDFTPGLIVGMVFAFFISSMLAFTLKSIDREQAIKVGAGRYNTISSNFEYVPNPSVIEASENN